jgi:hypothetical protein
MGAIRLRRFPAGEHKRLGYLLVRAKDGICSNSECIELDSLLGKARRISDANARAIAEARGVGTLAGAQTTQRSLG